MASTLARVLWFTVIGWWLGPLWFLLSVLAMGTIVLLPVGAYAATKTWQVMTLSASPTVVINEARDQRRTEPAD